MHIYYEYRIRKYEKRIPLLYLLINYKSTKPAPKSLSLKEE